MLVDQARAEKESHLHAHMRLAYSRHSRMPISKTARRLPLRPKKGQTVKRRLSQRIERMEEILLDLGGV
jgi:hypothetical protein